MGSMMDRQPFIHGKTKDYRLHQAPEQRHQIYRETDRSWATICGQFGCFWGLSQASWIDAYFGLRSHLQHRHGEPRMPVAHWVEMVEWTKNDGHICHPPK